MYISCKYNHKKKKGGKRKGKGKIPMNHFDIKKKKSINYGGTICEIGQLYILFLSYA